MTKGDMTLKYQEIAASEAVQTGHVSLETPLAAADVVAAANAYGWTARMGNRAAFSVVEVWYEDSHLIEFLDPENQPKTRAFATAASFDQMFGAPE